MIDINHKFERNNLYFEKDFSEKKSNLPPAYYSKWTGQISREIKSLNDYTGNGHFDDINSSLRLDFPVDLFNLEIIQNLDKIFDTMPEEYKVKSPETVYRGVRLDSLPENVKDIITLKNPTKNCFTDKAFTSTSYDKQSAKDYKGGDGILLEITLPKGSKRIDVNEMTLGNHFKNEEEALLPRNSEFRVDSYNPETKTAKLTYLGQKLPLPELKEKTKDSYEAEYKALKAYSEVKPNNNYDFMPYR